MMPSYDQALTDISGGSSSIGFGTVQTLIDGGLSPATIQKMAQENGSTFNVMGLLALNPMLKYGVIAVLGVVIITLASKK